jgi:hypothetical protein
VLIAVLFRNGNWAGRVKFGFGSDGLGQFDLLKEIGSDRVGSGSDRVNLHIIFFSDL